MKATFFCVVVVLCVGNVFADGDVSGDFAQQATMLANQWTSVQGPGYAESDALSSSGASSELLFNYQPTYNTNVRQLTPPPGVGFVSPMWQVPQNQHHVNGHTPIGAANYQKWWSKKECESSLKKIRSGWLEGLGGIANAINSSEWKSYKGFTFSVSLVDYTERDREDKNPKVFNITGRVDLEKFLARNQYVGRITVIATEKRDADHAVRFANLLALRYEGLEVAILEGGNSTVNHSNTSGISTAIGQSANFTALTGAVGLGDGKTFTGNMPFVILHVYRPVEENPDIVLPPSVVGAIVPNGRSTNQPTSPADYQQVNPDLLKQGQN